MNMQESKIHVQDLRLHGNVHGCDLSPWLRGESETLTVGTFGATVWKSGRFGAMSHLIASSFVASWARPVHIPVEDLWRWCRVGANKGRVLEPIIQDI